MKNETETQSNEQQTNPLKNKSVTLAQYLFSMLGVAIIVFSCTFFVMKKPAHVATSTTSSSSTEQDGLAVIDQAFKQIKSRYINGSKVKDQTLINGALKGMTDALGDPYSTYLSGKDMTDLNDTMSGSFEGIGAVLTLENGTPTIAEPPIKGSPAAKAKLKAKDIILKVDGKEVKGQTLNEIVQKVRGKKGTTVKLSIQRGSEKFDVALKRDTVPVTTVNANLDEQNKKIGNIQITSFAETTSDELVKAIDKLRKEGATSFVLDLRQNPGGLLDQVQKMASMFLKDGKTIIKFEDKNGKKSEVTAGKALDGGKKVTEPVVVLVDDGSASAAEIFAAALHDSANVPLIGKKTFGKGTVQSVFEISKQGELKLTIMKWLTPKGKWIHKKGIEPTIKADYPDYAYLTPIDKSKTYQKGDSDNSVKSLNAMLKSLGYLKTDVSDLYTDETVAGVKQFQKDSKLKDTGTLDSNTATKLEQKLTELIQANDQAYKQAIHELSEKTKK